MLRNVLFIIGVGLTAWILSPIYLSSSSLSSPIVSIGPENLRPIYQQSENKSLYTMILSNIRALWHVRTLLVFVLGLTSGVGITAYLVFKYSPSKRRGGHGSFPLWDEDWGQSRKKGGGGGKLKSKKLTSDESTEQRGQEEQLSRRNLILIRHGQYNHEGEGDDEHYLTPLGEQQARLLGERLKEMNEQVGGFNGIYFSSLQRAKQTARIAIAMGGIEGIFEEDPLLIEGIPCTPDPPSMSFSDVWLTPKEKLDQRHQMEAGFRKYFTRPDPGQEFDSHDVLMCHANVIRYFVCRALQFPAEAWLRFSLKSLDHTSLTILSIQVNGEVQLLRYGDSSHLPNDMRTNILQ